MEGSTTLALTARQDKLSDNRTYSNREPRMRMKDADGLTSQASSTLVSAFTDTIRESMRSGHSHEDRDKKECNLYTYLEQTPFSMSPAILRHWCRRHRQRSLGAGWVPSSYTGRISCFVRWILSESVSSHLKTSWTA
jgi:hypothetical protein